MPRAKTTEVIEHRITFGDLERKELKETLDLLDKDRKWNLGLKTAVGSAAVVGAVGIGYMGYLALLGIHGFVDKVTDPLKEAIWGKETYPSKDIPADPQQWVNRDPDTGERINPMHPVPVAGGLVGLGMRIGEAVPVGSWVADLFDIGHARSSDASASTGFADPFSQIGAKTQGV